MRMREVAVALATISIVGLCSVQAYAAPRWVKWQEELWLDMNSVSREGPLATFDTIQGKGDPVEIARDPDLHLRNRINCVARTHSVYSPILDLWSAESDKWEPGDERIFKLVCNRDLKH
jgi:hypothetical protein